MFCGFVNSTYKNAHTMLTLFLKPASASIFPEAFTRSNNHRQSPLTLTQSDLGKYIKFKVTPKALDIKEAGSGRYLLMYLEMLGIRMMFNADIYILS